MISNWRAEPTEPDSFPATDELYEELELVRFVAEALQEMEHPRLWPISYVERLTSMGRAVRLLYIEEKRFVDIDRNSQRARLTVDEGVTMISTLLRGWGVP
jgi:hypothetical protein